MEAEVDGCCCNVSGDATTPVEWKQMNGDCHYIISHAKNTHKPLAVTAMLEILDAWICLNIFHLCKHNMISLLN